MVGLTAVFGMGTGVPPPQQAPGSLHSIECKKYCNNTKYIELSTTLTNNTTLCFCSARYISTPRLAPSAYQRPRLERISIEY